uniref:Uncharacterized protein n=1 Tax=Vibrio vulnificus TaxID=672 RepID=A0AAI9EKR4_VIBVL|nr:hypothetical protein [Vibrio vulnificus]
MDFPLPFPLLERTGWRFQTWFFSKEANKSAKWQHQQKNFS